jgi:aminopeptidase N
MIRTILGAEDFRKGMDLYFERHDGDAATIEDFLACFAEASGRDLKQFALWYSQAGTPSVSVSSDWNETKKTFKVTLEQSLAPTPGQSRKALMHIPLAYGLILPDGREFDGQPDTGEAENGVFHLTKRKQTFSFLSDVPGRPVLSINRGFSAPVNIAMEQSPEDLAHISRHDSDGVARWQALNDYATRHLVAASRLARDGRNLPPASDLADVLIATAADDTLSPHSAPRPSPCRPKATLPAKSAPTSIRMRSTRPAKRCCQKWPAPVRTCSPRLPQRTQGRLQPRCGGGRAARTCGDRAELRLDRRGAADARQDSL